ncbi:NAD(P)-dependent dehydrogenase (short-subunit alcohol dehydrogenase family) [Amycolatopsis bartoniae]|uniref:Beta-ketoacyl-ACP reductase n=1 Tax=Amycolatopsis bartoniae TaxID=941986 RepID=A0A8H9INE6_9PSEU|nr:SDR family NAD(P)-dependent oxidoreductase [Amycolatopsis bartoniae]MBB2939927.1 NAD(P)-dependent dehydrogenase (short-subunit alcohol dehydrogenase family) [Amycolatopsis bartoniae]GHF35644.1 beta-ketoacyl-ACP reductase [Amycolatopsis bartoniae]
MSAENRPALVTGGAGWIGSALSQALAAAGHPVAIGYSSGEQRAAALAEKIAADGGVAIPVAFDLSGRDTIRSGLAEVRERLGQVSVVVNNAGVNVGKTVVRHTAAEWERLIQVNLTGPAFLVRECLPAMFEAGWGRVVNISSAAGQTPFLAAGPYGASKAGLNMFTRVVALEVANKGVTSNALSPGVVASDMLTRHGDAILDLNVQAQSLKRPIEPGEIAAALAFLVSDEAAAVNGHVLAIDGGGPTFLPRLPKKQDRTGGRSAP